MKEAPHSANKPQISGRSDDFYRAFLTGYGALFFAPTPVSGALFLLGTFAASAMAGIAVLLGLLSATAAAHLLKRDHAEVEQGLYGFNGALVAFAVLSMNAAPELLFMVLIPAAALTARLTAWLLDCRWGARWGMPALSLPSLLVGLPVVWALAQWGNAEPHAAAMLPAFLNHGDWWNPAYYSTSMLEAVGGIQAQVPVFVLFVAGFFLYSKRLLVHLLAGLAVGAVIGFAFLGWLGAFDFLFVVVTAVPVFVAIAAVFTVGGWRSWLYASAAVTISFPIWFYVGLFLTDHNMPLLTVPFWSTTILFLLTLRALSNPASASKTWLPQIVPLHRAGSAADPSRWMEDRKFGWQYWQDVARIQDRDWRDFTDEQRMERGRSLVRRSRRIAVLTGAGMSTESNIPDYRSGAVAWKSYDTSHFRWQQFLDSEVSRKHYWEMSQDFYMLLRTAEPNPAHRSIAELHRRSKLRAVITQNVDRLHQAAGLSDEKVIEIHGNEHQVSCLNCGEHYTRDEVYRWIVDGVAVPYCAKCQGILKPDSIAFDQPMPEDASRQALAAIQDCDLLVVVGTSLEVQPVSTLPLIALRAGIPLILVNLNPTDYDAFATCVFRGTCGAILPELFATPSLKDEIIGG